MGVYLYDMWIALELLLHWNLLIHHALYYGISAVLPDHLQSIPPAIFCIFNYIHVPDRSLANLPAHLVTLTLDLNHLLLQYHNQYAFKLIQDYHITHSYFKYKHNCQETLTAHLIIKTYSHSTSIHYNMSENIQHNDHFKETDITIIFFFVLFTQLYFLFTSGNILNLKDKYETHYKPL